MILFLGKYLFKRGAGSTGSNTLLCVIPFRAFHINFPANKPFQNISKETCSPRLLSDFYKPEIRALYNETINNDSFLLLATTKPVDNKNSAVVSKLPLYWNIAMYNAKEIIRIQLARKSDGFSGTSHTRAVIQTHIGRTINESQNTSVLFMLKFSSSKGAWEVTSV